MACRRKMLAASYDYLSQRLHPSYFHIFQYNKERSRSPEPLPLSETHLASRATTFSRQFATFRSAIRDWRMIGFSLPLGVDHFSRSYSSGAEGSDDVGYINNVAEVLTDPGIESSITTAAPSIPTPFPGEVAAAAEDSFLPVAALQHLIDSVHSFTGLNWWASIAVTTLMIRGAALPFLINQLKATMKLNTLRPELEKLKKEISKNKNPETLQENQKRMKALFKKHGVTPFTPLRGILIQGPVFMCFYFAVSNMVQKVPSFKGGGAYWFTDLTTPDTMYIFPALTALSFLATVELNMQEGLEGNPTAKVMKNMFRVLGILTVPFTANFPKAIFCYWITSNLFSLVYGFAIKRPLVRKFLNLPIVLPQPNSSPLPNFSFGGSKPVRPLPSTMPEKESEAAKTPGRVSSSTVINQRIRNLEKVVKPRTKPKKR